MKISNKKRVLTKKLIASLCSIIDEIDYSAYSKGKAKGYLEYIKGSYKDELKLVDSVFFPKLAERILGFTIGISLIPKEKAGSSGGRPDFLPKDLNLHSFLFETKGSDCEDLAIHYPQLRGYIEKSSTDYGIILNLSDVRVFTNTSSEPISDLTFSLEQLYRNFKSNPETIESQVNTRHFLDFVSKFSYQKLDLIKKIEKIAESKPWTGEEVLSLDDLTKKIREVVSILHYDVRNQKENLRDLLGYDNKRKEQIAWEIEAIAESLDSKKPKREISASTLGEMFRAKSGSLDERAVDSYLYRVAYFTMTRILLVRLWEDIGFIDQSLYDGGFKIWYENFKNKIEEVLRYAFNLAGQRYSWLFNKENNYTWYYPGDTALVDILYEFSHFNFSKLNADVLGTIYEEYVDRVDRKNKGQYYTPREVVSFIWDLVGFTDDNAFFRFENGMRKPRLIFDPATGSGGFLVEAARRIREEAAYNEKDIRDLFDIESSVIRGLYGSEISAFPYYITEINLLIQLTPIIKKILDAHKYLYKHPEFTLSVIHQDSLKLHNEPSLEVFGQHRMGYQIESYKERDQEYEKDKKHDIVSLEGQKLDVYKYIKECMEFDYVCANPPYIGEKGHKELFRATLEQFPYWKTYYQGKMDYLYWFVTLGLSKLREGGKLGFITTSYWPTADGATKLRKFILDNAVIKEIVDFGETKIFEGAPGQHNMVFVLEKCGDSKKRSENSIKIVKVKKQLEGKGVREKTCQLLAYIKARLNENDYKDNHIEVFISPVRQGELMGDAWGFIKGTKNTESLLSKLEKSLVKLSDLCSVNQGIVSSADKVISRNYPLLHPDVIQLHNIKIGDGIFLLTKEELDALSIPKAEQKLIRYFYQNVDVGSYVPEKPHWGEDKFLIYINKDIMIEDYPIIHRHLERFKAILSSKRETRQGKIPWFSLHWPREQELFEGVKIVSPHYRFKRPFIYSEGDFYTSDENYIIKKKPNVLENEKYILGILNSDLLDVWYINRLTLKGSGYEFLGKKLQQIPIRRIDFNNPKEVRIHDHLVKFVDKIIEVKKELATFNRYFPTTRLTRLQDEVQLPEINNEEIIKGLERSQLRNIRTHPDITYTPQKIQGFYLKKMHEDGKKLILNPKDNCEIVLKAPKKLLDYLKVALPSYIGKEWSEIINQVLVPSEVSIFEKKKNEILSTVKTLLKETKKLQREIDEIVYSLYGLSEEEKQIVSDALKDKEK